MWLPDSVSDDQAIMLSDIYPTAWFGCRLAEVAQGDTVLVLGAGPAGQFAVTSALQQGAGRVLCVRRGLRAGLEQACARRVPRSSTSTARDPLEVMQELTGGIAVDRVGRRRRGRRPSSRAPAPPRSRYRVAFEQVQSQVAPEQNPQGERRSTGDDPDACHIRCRPTMQPPSPMRPGHDGGIPSAPTHQTSLIGDRLPDRRRLHAQRTRPVPRMASRRRPQLLVRASSIWCRTRADRRGQSRANGQILMAPQPLRCPTADRDFWSQRATHRVDQKRQALRAMQSR
ncbi:MAG: hypothetical protein WKF73_06770 [Nocardioidaceae bacterium]